MKEKNCTNCRFYKEEKYTAWCASCQSWSEWQGKKLITDDVEILNQINEFLDEISKTDKRFLDKSLSFYTPKQVEDALLSLGYLPEGYENDHTSYFIEYEHKLETLPIISLHVDGFNFKISLLWEEKDEEE